jgi:RNA polymerase sigma factor (sigma-70 family)
MTTALLSISPRSILYKMHRVVVGGATFRFTALPMSASDIPALYRPGVAEDEQHPLDALHRAHGNWLLAFLRRRFSPQDAEDLAQETYVRTVGARTEIRNPRAFLARVALRAAHEFSEQKANRLVLWTADDADAALLPDQETALLFKQVVLDLPKELQVVFLLSRFDGLSNEEIARRCGISVKRVEARLTKARARLAALLRE